MGKGAVCPSDSEKFAKHSGKRGQNQEKEGKNWERREKIGKKEKLRRKDKNLECAFTLIAPPDGDGWLQY